MPKACKVGDNHALSFIEKKVMAPRTNGGITHGTAHSSHIRHENYEFTDVGGLAPMFAFSCGPDLLIRDLDPMVYGEHTLRITLSGSC
jgi:hypothetical protein